MQEADEYHVTDLIVLLEDHRPGLQLEYTSPLAGRPPRAQPSGRMINTRGRITLRSNSSARPEGERAHRTAPTSDSKTITDRPAPRYPGRGSSTEAGTPIGVSLLRTLIPLPSSQFAWPGDQRAPR
jgi:hypothetical protein